MSFFSLLKHSEAQVYYFWFLRRLAGGVPWYSTYMYLRFLHLDINVFSVFSTKHRRIDIRLSFYISTAVKPKVIMELHMKPPGIVNISSGCSHKDPKGSYLLYKARRRVKRKLHCKLKHALVVPWVTESSVGLILLQGLRRKRDLSLTSTDPDIHVISSSLFSLSCRLSTEL